MKLILLKDCWNDKRSNAKNVAFFVKIQKTRIFATKTPQKTPGKRTTKGKNVTKNQKIFKKNSIALLVDSLAKIN